MSQKKGEAPDAAKQHVIKRRDATGHLDPKYEADLLARSHGSAPERDEAFVTNRGTQDPLAEELGEEFVKAATSGEDLSQDTRDAEVTEEVGGPFVETSGRTEFAHGTDASNPKGTLVEPFPKS